MISILIESALLFYLCAVLGHIGVNIYEGYAWDDELQDIAYPWRWSCFR